MLTNLREPVTSDRLVGIQDAADALGVSQPTVRGLVKAGTLSPVRLVAGGRLRFRLSELERLIHGTQEEENDANDAQ